MYKNLLTNPITGKIIQKTKLTHISMITHNFNLKPDKTKMAQKKPKVKMGLNITDDEYFQKFILTSQ